MKVKINVQLEFGNEGAQEIGKIKKDELKSSWGWNGEDKSWDTWIIVNADLEDMGYVEKSIPYVQLKITLKYCTSENEWNDLKKALGIDDNKSNPEIDFSSRLTQAGENLNNVVDTVEDIATIAEDLAANFFKNPWGTIISTLMDFFGKVGDAFQWLANTIQLDDIDKVLYTYQFLEGNVDANQYTNVGNKDTKTKAIKNVKIEKDRNNNKTNDFSKDTKIPLMVGDIYNISVGHIDFLDTNFLTGLNETKNDQLIHQEGSAWAVLRNFAAAVIHICIYISSALLIISLIWYGVKILSNSLDNPGAKAKYKEGLERFKTSLLMLIGSIIIMALCIFGTKAFARIMETESYELPIRVNVEGTYSFSTTATGYVRYMSLTEDVDEWLQKVACTMSYLLLSIMNLAIVFIMVGRVFILWVLSMIGPIISAMYVFKKEGFMSFGTWTELYVCISIVQVIIAVIYKLILEVIIV